MRPTLTTCATLAFLAAFGPGGAPAAAGPPPPWRAALLAAVDWATLGGGAWTATCCGRDDSYVEFEAETPSVLFDPAGRRAADALARLAESVVGGLDTGGGGALGGCPWPVVARRGNVRTRVAVELLLGTARPARVRVVSDLGDDELERCVAKRVRRWRFPKAGRGLGLRFGLLYASNFSAEGLSFLLPWATEGHGAERLTARAVPPERLAAVAVRVGAPAVEGAAGPLPAATARAYAPTGSPTAAAVKACWALRVAWVSDADQALTLSLTIAPDGAVEWVGGSGDPPFGAALADCVGERLKGLRFPASAESRELRVPIAIDVPPAAP